MQLTKSSGLNISNKIRITSCNLGLTPSIKDPSSDSFPSFKFYSIASEYTA